MAPLHNEFQQSSRRARQKRIRLLLSLGAVALTVALTRPMRQGIGGALVEAYAVLPVDPGAR